MKIMLHISHASLRNSNAKGVHPRASMPKNRTLCRVALSKMCKTSPNDGSYRAVKGKRYPFSTILFTSKNFKNPQSTYYLKVTYVEIRKSAP